MAANTHPRSSPVRREPRRGRQAAPVLRPLALSLMCMGAAPALAQTNLPTGFSPLNGAASMSSAANLMTVQQNGMRGVVRWSDFSIGNGYTVQFNQSPGAVLLNRVVGSGGVIPQSRIDGTLNAPNGHIFLLNPSGVLFGATAAVNVGGLVASTLALSDDAFMAPGASKGIQPGEQFVFTRPEAGFANVSVDKGAVITARQAEGSTNPTVVLMGANVRNDGEINVARGSAGLLSGPTVTLDYGGDGLTTFNVAKDALASSSKVVNTGTITADGGRIALLAVADAAGLVVNQGGVLQAGSISQRNGEIRLEGAEVQSVGALRATSTTTGVAGGSIDVVAAKVSFEGEVDASGLGGGGRITVAGNDVTLAGSVKADALAGGGGSGGRVTVQNIAADSLLQLQGSISARGDGAGAGGTVVTGAGQVIVHPDASVDAGGAAGRNGSWTLSSGLDLRVQGADEPFPLDGLSTVGAITVGRALGRGTDVTLERRAVAVGDDNGDGITFGSGAQVIKDTGGAAILTVNSARNISMQGGAVIGSTAGALNVDFNADSKGSAGTDAVAADGATLPRRGGIRMDDATIASNGGNIRFFGQSDPVNGRAVGDRQDLDGEPRRTAGIEVNHSTVSTCGVAQASCAGGGSITMRGEGSTGVFGGSLSGTAGISVQGSQLVTGSGAISLAGRGGIGATGLDVGSFYDGEAFIGSRITSGTGKVTLVGSSRDWVAGDAVGFTDAGTGVALNSATIETGGSVQIEGTGGNLAAMAASTEFQSLVDGSLDGTAGSRSLFSGDGVSMQIASITAGKGQTVNVLGTGGSPSLTVESDGAGTFTTTVNGDARGVAFDSARIVAESGTIRIDGGASTVDLNGINGPQRPDEPGLLLSTASATGPGGTIDIRGRNVRIEGANSEGVQYALLDASGAGRGGTIDVRAVGASGVAASGILGIDFNVAMTANAIGTGHGGSITVLGDNTLRAFGSFQAKGAGAGGNGGFVETSGGAFDVRGIQVDASAGAGGRAGTWLLDPFNVTIAHGPVSSVLTSPFVPLANSIIQDSDINVGLTTGDVRITTGAGPLSSGVGTISMVDAQIEYSGAADRTFQLDAHTDITSTASTTIAGFDPSSGVAGGKLNVVFNADVNGGSLAGSGGGQVTYNGTIHSNGGDVTMNGALADPFGFSNGCSVCLNGSVIDTRAGNFQLSVGTGPIPSTYTGGSDALAGGKVSLTGRTTSANPSNFSVSAGVDINNTLISTSTGNVAILGTSTVGTGVSINANISGPSGIYTTSGNISVTGVGSDAGGNSANLPGHGVVLGAGFPFTINGTPTLQTTTGDIDITGLRLVGGTAPVLGSGVLVGNRSLVTTLAGGDIVVTGESQGNGAGVSMPAETVITTTIPAGQIVGSNNVTLRAANDGTTDALAINVGAVVQAGNVLDLRPGGVDLAGPPEAYVPTAVDRVANAITLGGAANTGFAVSAAEFTRISGATVVAGSNTHAGNIDVIGPLTMASPLTLQNGGGGNITLGAPVTTPQFGLLSAGNITQVAGANIAAGVLLARSTGGNVLLGNAGNNVGTVGGGAAGRFEYVDADALTLGAVTVTGFDAASNLPQLVSAGGMQADTVFVRNLSGDLTLGGNVTSGSGADLVTAARLQNPGGYALGGAPWRVWADTWVGETRGGLAGSGTLPNLFHCAFLGLCTVSVPASGNHFIYAQQPTATVRIGNVTRPFGLANPFLVNFGVTGLILGDTAVSFSGTQSTPATSLSLPGTYPINGFYTSAAGYAVEVVPGSLLISAALDFPKVDVLRDLPTTYVYDRNIGQAPICLATGPLDGDRAQQGADVLAREWSKVRSRPNLLSCVDTERRNGCADF